jgi:hypothetical protein
VGRRRRWLGSCLTTAVRWAFEQLLLAIHVSISSMLDGGTTSREIRLDLPS